MSSGALAAAFGAGMLASVNPCGFAMLPAYLSTFLGIDEASELDTPSALLRSVRIGLAMTSGFLIVFVTAGFLIEGLSFRFERWLPYLTILIGTGLVVMGVAMARGWSLTLAMPHLEKGGSSSTFRSMFLFGVSYAVASLSCTIAVFLSVVAGSLTADNWADGLTRFVAFGLGMGSVVLALSASLALARQGLLKNIRSALPYVNRAAGALLLVTGSYLAYYGWFEIRILDDARASGGGLFDRVNSWNDGVRRWIDSVGPVRLGGSLLLIVAALVFLAMALRARTPRAIEVGSAPGEALSEE